MSHSIIDKKERSVLENTAWTLKEVEWHRFHGHGDLIGCSLRIGSLVPPRRCSVYVHVPEDVTGRALESSHVTIERTFLGFRQFGFAPGEISIESQSTGRGVVQLSGLLGQDGDTEAPVRLTFTVPALLLEKFEKAKRFCAEQCAG